MRGPITISRWIFNYLHSNAAPSSTGSLSKGHAMFVKKVTYYAQWTSRTRRTRLRQNSPADWMNEEIKLRVWLKEGGDREKLEVYWEKPGLGQVRFIESVTMVTDRELKLSLFLKLAGLPLFLWFVLPPFVKWKVQSFPHFRVNKLRVFTRLTLWNGPQRGVPRM